MVRGNKIWEVTQEYRRKKVSEKIFLKRLKIRVTHFFHMEMISYLGVCVTLEISIKEKKLAQKNIFLFFEISV